MRSPTGSSAFVAAARAAYLVVDHPDDEHQRCMLPLKNNVGDDKIGFGYQIRGVTLDNGIETSRIEWVEGALELNAQDVLEAKRERTEPDANKPKRKATVFLLEILRDGPVSANEISAQRDELEIAEATLNRAKKALQIISERVPDGPGWQWRLPTSGDFAPTSQDQDHQTGSPQNSDDVDNLDNVDGEITDLSAQDYQGYQDNHILSGQETDCLEYAKASGGE